jgi:hypothetical protein
VTDAELDAVYTHLCRVMTALGEPAATLFLARFALLAITHIDDAQAAARLIDDAAEALPPAPRD